MNGWSISDEKQQLQNYKWWVTGWKVIVICTGCKLSHLDLWGQELQPDRKGVWILPKHPESWVDAFHVWTTQISTIENIDVNLAWHSRNIQSTNIHVTYYRQRYSCWFVFSTSLYLPGMDFQQPSHSCALLSPLTLPIATHFLNKLQSINILLS